MRELYKRLYNDCLQSDTFKEDAHFVSMQGVFYEENEKKLLLIGRAPNGWGSLITDTADSFASDAQKQFDDCHRFNWIESINGTLYSTHDREKDSRYCIDTKPFWYYAKEIWQKLPGSASDCYVWTENIAWSNLYKVSPLVCDNPNDESMRIQRLACIDILKKELAVYKPTHILFLTGYDWFEPFSCLFDYVTDLGVRNVMKGSQKNEIYVEGTADYHGAKAVIACRPEHRKKDGFVDAVLRAFEGNII